MPDGCKRILGLFTGVEYEKLGIKLEKNICQ